MFRAVVLTLAFLLPTGSALAGLKLYPISGPDLPEVDDGTGPRKFNFAPYK